MTDHPLAFIDALRGYAITLVIASHAFPMVHELPWTVKRFSNLGFFGVQLFFVVSCFTLARSWRGRERVARPGLRDFALRRLFRIAPAYFLAALAYFWLSPNMAIDATRIATFLTFTNGWSPAQMPTVPGVWVGVPGGWSIEAEFAFYAIFPFLVMTLRGPGAALAAVAVSLPAAWIANMAGRAAYGSIYGATATDQFLYYWLPNELPVFLCGLVAYECIVRLSPGGPWRELGERLARRSGLLLTVSVLLFAALGVVSWPRLPQAGSGFVATPLIAAIAFAGTVSALALGSFPLVVNGVIIRLGQASFSAYLLHFAVLETEQRLLPRAVFASTGVLAAATGGVLFLVTLGATGLIAQATYRLVELPAIRLGAWTNRQLTATLVRS
jgi:peptidoglycan/LPS O-acetylase OafA/YrhL